MQNKIPHDKSKKVTISYKENPRRPRNHSAGTHRIQSGDLCVLYAFHLGIAHLRLAPECCLQGILLTSS